MTTYYCKKHGAMRVGDLAFDDYCIDPAMPLCKQCLHDDFAARGIGVLTETPPPEAPKPCPFCGSGDTDVRSGAAFLWFGHCASCHADGPTHQNAADAIAKWNKRA